MSIAYRVANGVLVLAIIVLLIQAQRGAEVPKWSMAIIGLAGIVQLIGFSKGLYDRRYVSAPEINNG